MGKRKDLVRNGREFSNTDERKHQETDFSWQFPIKFNTHFLCDPPVPLLGIYIQKKWKQYPHKHLYAHTYGAFIHNHLKLKIKCPSTGNWLVLFTYLCEYYSQNLGANYDKQLLFRNFCGSSIWMWLSWVPLVQNIPFLELIFYN